MSIPPSIACRKLHASSVSVDPHVVGAGPHPLVVRRWRHQLGRTHVGPDDATSLIGRVGLDRDAQPELAVRRLGRHVHAVAQRVELPAVIHTPQPALLVAAVEQRRATMSTVRIDHADVTGRVTERDQILAKQPHPDRGPVRLADLFGQAGRDPVPPEHLAHRSALTDTGQPLVELCRDMHPVTLSSCPHQGYPPAAVPRALRSI